ncbi:DUF1365 domain-containing protein [Kitasatospora sp. DSM 101779]|uniref:DUF1365 domain-containing protein n=1 Tax=Kitasatospora sp. DSM 101779 TaxID=2853165 RepID=UPI0021D90E6E|nr:DUF1365 domain-containing protein [Kitasatospora sp. DSM 101779]MCU7821223.1 DUF1365 domain-containing protein [Kitasatospora sp. DSM 101779]
MTAAATDHRAPATALPGPWGAALYECRITHVRTAPVRHAFRHRTYLWLVDLDRLPVLPRPLRPLARFRAADHPGDPRGTLRGNLAQYLAGQGIDLAGGRVLMLAQARSLGHVFNPLTVYWCRAADGTPLCTVAEVHNTYGGHHRYLLRPGADGRASVAKEFYVSPFFPVDGRYRMTVPQPGERLALTVRLERDGGSPFIATVRGRRSPAGPAALLLAALRHPLATLAVSVHIRHQGIRLLLKGLPVHPRRGPLPADRTGSAATEEVSAP